VDDRRTRFERLYADHAPEIAMYALRRTDRESAQDVVAETYAVVWRRVDEVPQDALPWLYAVARRVLANQRRSSTRLAALRRRLEAQPPAGPELADGSVAAALASLSPADREVLLLVAWEGLSAVEASTVLGCSPEACRVRLHRARTRFANALEPSPNGATTKRAIEEVP
jgi:RNA polymerase sigma-70 factor (ECF subfamily)